LSIQLFENLFLLLILLSLSFFFSGSETAFFSLPRVVAERLKQASASGKRVAEMLDQPNRLLVTILLGNLTANILISEIIGVWSLRIFDPLPYSNSNYFGGFAAILLTTAVLLLFAEIAPKTLAINNAERFSLGAAIPLKAFSNAVYPLLRTVLLFTDSILRLFGISKGETDSVVTEEELKTLVAMSEEEGVLESSERLMIHRIIEFGDTLVRDVYVPRTDMVRVRFPVYGKTVDDIKGIVYAKDLFPYFWRGQANIPISRFIRPAYYVPETKKVRDLLREFQTGRLHMAVVVGEYGGTKGLVTLEDLIEEVVGEIFDEYDVRQSERRPLGSPGRKCARARMRHGRRPDIRAAGACAGPERVDRARRFHVPGRESGGSPDQNRAHLVPIQRRPRAGRGGKTVMDLTDTLLLAGLLLAILMSAFFSGIETGLISLNRIALRRREEKGESRAVMLGSLLQRPERLLATILVGNNLVNVTATVIFLMWSTRLWGSARAEWLTPLALTPILLVMGEILPKTTFRHRADTLSPAFAPFLRAIVFLFSPGVNALTRISNRLTGLLGGDEKHSPFMSREDVRLLFLEGERNGVIEEDERELIHGVIDFGTTTVREVIVPRIDMIAVRDDATWEEVCETYEAHGHSRLPVYHEKIDEIVGMVYIFDLMRAGKPPEGDTIREFIRDIPFIPESKRIQDLLQEFRQKQMFMAIVVDEYGGTAGLVTLEDLIEEIFGEIRDEYDVKELPVKNLGAGLFVLDARMHRDEAEELLGIKLPEGEYETLGGFIFERLGRIPRKGESFQYDNCQVTILEASERAVTRVRFKLGQAGGKRRSKGRKQGKKH